MRTVLTPLAILGSFAYTGNAVSVDGSTIRGNKRSPLGLSLPPLIPAIPGVTEPLIGAAPPLPILQIPTPPLDSPPFEVSNIKPKKIGYFWTGAGDNHHKDFLVTTSLDDVSQTSLPLIQDQDGLTNMILRTPSEQLFTSLMFPPVETPPII